jgi:hypothetical protein
VLVEEGLRRQNPPRPQSMVSPAPEHGPSLSVRAMAHLRIRGRAHGGSIKAAAAVVAAVAVAAKEEAAAETFPHH